jgi:Cu/Ag efflux pump CusA
MFEARMAAQVSQHAALVQLRIVADINHTQADELIDSDDGGQAIVTQVEFLQRHKRSHIDGHQLTIRQFTDNPSGKDESFK